MATKLYAVCLVTTVAVILMPPHCTAQSGSDLVRPRPIYLPAPEYSEPALRAQFQGTCILRVFVSADGSVHDVQVARHLGMGLDEKAVEAIRQSRFQPAIKDGSPVAAEISIEVTFRLGSDADAQQKLLNALPPPLELPISTTVKPCPQSFVNTEGHGAASAPAVTVADLTFEGATQVPLEEQDRIVASIKARQFAGSPEGVGDAVFEMVREAWQDRGFFKVQVGGDSEVLTSNAVSSRIAVDARIDEGEQYRLAEITFNGNKAITNAQALRDLFPIKDGDIFSRKQVAEGLENLRQAYKVQGYVNATFVPTPSLNDDDNSVRFAVDVDEGKQFFVSSINLVGEDADTLNEVGKDLLLKVGQLYNQNLLDLFAEKHPFANGKNSLTQFRLNERDGTVAITLDLRQCQGQ